MKTRLRRALLLPFLALLLTACDHDEPQPVELAIDPISLVMAPHRGEGEPGDRIRRAQQDIARMGASAERLERLGWAFESLATIDSDPGAFRLAEQCALASLSLEPGRGEGLILLGHALHSLHRFEEAEGVARRLVAQRGIAVDWGLLGDVRFDRGDLVEAANAYQRMMDLRPDGQAFARAAKLRYSLGDVESAGELMLRAVRATSPRDPNAYAWMHAELARIAFHMGRSEAALAIVDAALARAPKSAAALHQKGRILLSLGRLGDAQSVLRRASEISRLPEHALALAEAHAAAGDLVEAEAQLALLARVGEGADPRGLALALATTGRDPERAVVLAEAELRRRQDVFTLDVAAWSHAGAGDLARAWSYAERALSSGIEDARVLLHAGVIASRRGDHETARALFARARPLAHTLLPTERQELSRFFETWES